MMTQRPAIYRGFRLGDALALAAVAAVTVTALPAGAAVRDVSGAGEPSAEGRDLAYQRVDGGGILRRGRSVIRLPGSAPAVGGPFIAVRQPGQVVLLGRKKLVERGRFRAPGADGLAVSGTWIAYRARRHGRDSIRARRIFHRGVGPGHPAGRAMASAAGIAFGPVRIVARARRSGGLSRPGLSGAKLVYSSSSRRGSAIVQRLLGGDRRRILVRSRRWLVSEPSIQGRSFAYVRTTNERQQLRVRRLSRRGKGKVVFAVPATSFRDRDHDPGHSRLHTRVPKPDRRRSNWNLLATAIAPGRVYATLLRDGRRVVRARIIRTGR